MCHDFGENREVEFETTMEKECEENIHANIKVAENQYVVMREEKDKTLNVPHLIIPSLQVNMRAGHFPLAEDNGQIYLKLPINLLSE